VSWDAVVHQYRWLVLLYVKRHHAWVERGELDDEYWVMRVFQRFWSAVKADRFHQFRRLASVVAYLKLCAHSVLLDELRAARAAQVFSLDRVSKAYAAWQDVGTEVVGKLSCQILWRAVLSEAQGSQEPVVARLSWVQGMQPSEIYAARPGLFESVGAVYRIKRNLLERLRKNPLLAELSG
jgi:hypothetical protein